MSFAFSVQTLIVASYMLPLFNIFCSATSRLCRQSCIMQPHQLVWTATASQQQIQQWRLMLRSRAVELNVNTSHEHLQNALSFDLPCSRLLVPHCDQPNKVRHHLRKFELHSAHELPWNMQHKGGKHHVIQQSAACVSCSTYGAS